MDPYEKEQILSNKISHKKKVASASGYNEDQSIISIYKGRLDSSIRVCIKVYKQTYSDPPNLFLKELEFLTKYSEKNQSILRYIGWFQRLSDIQNSDSWHKYAIVTERFDNTLMDDIVDHYKNNKKYAYQEYQEIVVGLLKIFSFLESQGIIHKNVRPQNIVITPNRELKITGFHLSDIFSLNSPVLYTNDTESIWNDSFTAPEITKFFTERDSPNIAWEKCDVYSLGLVFLQMYSLLPIAELNTPSFWGEIEEYVSTFKPKNVALLLKNMLTENSAERASFKKCLEIFAYQEKNENEPRLYDQSFENRNELSINFDLSNCIGDLVTISEDLIQIYQTPRTWKDLPNGVRVEYFRGLYYEKEALIRIYRSQDPKSLVPYVEEAKVLKEINGKHPAFLEYYGSICSYKKYHEFSIVTEWCYESLMSDITNRRSSQAKYKKTELLVCAEKIFELLIALKKAGYYHGNIKPHNITWNTRSEITITGIYIPKAGIYSEGKFPENTDNFIQSEEGYASPETKDIEEPNHTANEKSDIFSLGLVLLQMINLDSVANWNNNMLKQLQYMPPQWLSKSLQQMLISDPEQRGDLETTLNGMKRNAADRVNKKYKISKSLIL